MNWIAAVLFSMNVFALSPGQEQALSKYIQKMQEGSSGAPRFGEMVQRLKSLDDKLDRLDFDATKSRDAVNKMSTNLVENDAETDETVYSDLRWKNKTLRRIRTICCTFQYKPKFKEEFSKHLTEANLKQVERDKRLKSMVGLREPTPAKP